MLLTAKKEQKFNQQFGLIKKHVVRDISAINIIAALLCRHQPVISQNEMKLFNFISSRPSDTYMRQ